MSTLSKTLAAQVDRSSRTEQPAPISSVASCPNKNWVELVYKYDSGRAVSGAGYDVFDAASGKKLKSGTLDQMGFARVDGLPDSVNNIKFSFTSDPKPFEIYPQFQPAPHNFTPATTMIEEEDGTFVSVAKWIGVSLAGDFVDDQSIGQVAFGAVVTTVPVVDQVGDIRDIIANLYQLGYRKRYNEFSPWFSLVATVVGCVPVVGSVVKGVVKTIYKTVKTGAKRLPLKHLIRLLNSVGEGNVVRFLREFLDRSKSHTMQAIAKIKQIIEAFQGKLEKLRAAAFGKTEEMIDELLAGLKNIHEMAPQWARKIFDWIIVNLKKTLDEAGDYMLTGATRTRAGAKQLKEKFLRAVGVELSKLAYEVGMEPKHIERLAEHCRQKGQMIVLRATNADSLRFHGVNHYLPKPLDVKLKTGKGDDVAKELRGLVIRPKEPMAKWERENIAELESKGYKFDKENVLRDPQGNAFYGDHDVQSVHRRVEMTDPDTGKTETVYLNEFSNPEDGTSVIEDMNRSVMDNPAGKEKPFQHGAEGDYRVKLDENGNTVYKDGKPVTVKFDEMNTGGKNGEHMKAYEDYRLGRQYEADEKYLVINADGNYQVVDAHGMQTVYLDAELPWEYNASVAFAPAKPATAAAAK